MADRYVEPQGPNTRLCLGGCGRRIKNVGPGTRLCRICRARNENLSLREANASICSDQATKLEVNLTDPSLRDLL